MTTAVLLDHVRAYAQAVRAHLGDLPTEVMEELTDGLEADLAEALDDVGGPVPVATGEVPVVGSATVGDGAGSTMVDLTRRFGPAAEYAAELRAAAGYGTAATGAGAAGGPRTVRSHLRGAVSDARGRLRAARDAREQTPLGQVVRRAAPTVRPVWWVLRGWVWFHIVLSLSPGWAGWHPLGAYVPMGSGTWLLLGALVILSVEVGRGLGSGHRWWRKVVAVANVLALVVLVPSLSYAARDARAMTHDPETVYIEVPGDPTAARVEDGVRVDGQLVSNLFVYDAEGNPLSDVQIFDDRGRPVRTTYDEGTSEWALPGMKEPWFFVPATDADGRTRWNVYPLLGVPLSEAEGAYPPAPDAGRRPPHPFAKAPALVAEDAGAPDTAAPADEPVAPTEGSAPQPVATPGAAVEAP